MMPRAKIVANWEERGIRFVGPEFGAVNVVVVLGVGVALFARNLM